MGKDVHGYWDKEEIKMETVYDEDQSKTYEIGDTSPDREDYQLYLKRKYVLGTAYLWKRKKEKPQPQQ